MKGNHSSDFSDADEIFARQNGWLNSNGDPIKARAAEYRVKNKLTWHHHEDGTTMQLVPKNLNNKVPHTGGASVVRNQNI